MKKKKQTHKVKTKIKTAEQLDILLSEKFRKDNTVVFTNGCFDILHPGHFHLLSTAKKHGNILIVGLNSDSSVSRLKGPGRPINDEESRALKLAALDYVDYVVLFSEDTPEKLIHTIKPNILIKGGDYDGDTIVGSAFVKKSGGKVEIIPLLEGYSTTNIIKNGIFKPYGEN